MDRLVVGQVLGAHGTAGRVRVLPLTDFPERLERLRDTVLRLPSGDRPVRVEGASRHGLVYLMKFEGCDALEAAERLRGAYLTVALEEAAPLPPGAYYHYQIVGLRVVEEGGRPLGTVREVLRTGANDVYVVERAGGSDLLLPALKRVVRDINLEEGVMVIRPLGEWLE